MKERNNIRYRFEHRELRDCYFNDPVHFAETMLGEPSALFRMLDGFYKKNGMKNPYGPEQVAASLVAAADGTCAVKVSLPIPEEPPLCRRIYAFVDMKENKPGFFCVESDCDRDDIGAHIGQWHYDGKQYAHLGYAGRPSTQEEEFNDCAEYYRDFDPGLIVRLVGEAEKIRQEKKLQEETTNESI